MKTHITLLNARYLDFEGNNITIGGVQTYISNLAIVAAELGLQFEVYQFANRDFCKNYNGITVHGVGMNMAMDFGKKSLMLYQRCMRSFDREKGILIFGTDTMIVKNNEPFALAIQHGIGWDIESEQPCSRFENIIQIIRQARRSAVIINKASYVKKMICVDYNYINWYRTQVKHSNMDYQVIPNFAKIPTNNSEKFDNSDKIKIIFARRLVKYRGTRIFADAVEKLLKDYNNLEVTFAGDGPEEEYLKQKFKSNDCVKFITYKSDESFDVHRDKHIAVVPTVGSEGTSLSLLEAMASTCAVVCTNVGGMTNIVIDNFNGFMINPDTNQLFEALKKLVDDKCKCRRMADEAYNTVQNGFSFDIWKEKWEKILRSCINEGSLQ